MKAKDLIKALKVLDPESDVIINIKQWNKAYGVVQLPIEYSNAHRNDERKPEGEYDPYLNQWVNSHYQGSITVHLPEGAYISKLPKGF